MSAHCCPTPPPAVDPRYRRVLWLALVVNAMMFGAEMLASWTSGSVALLADAIDFLGDAANYALSLSVLGMALAVRAKAALLKASCMAAFGIFVLGKATWRMASGDVPEPFTMGAVGFVALAANVLVAWSLYRYRSGDANMRSVWICSRNDAIGNVAVMLAALGVLRTGDAWPDLAVAMVMGVLALTGAATVARQARLELHSPAHQTIVARYFEHRVPPPAVGLLLGSGMWATPQVSPTLPLPGVVGLSVGIALAVVGAVIALLGAIAFRQARTTVNPLKPESSSALVVSGVYRYTRNPMYLGFACALLGWAVMLGAPAALLGPVLFVLFISRFQIAPEERALRMNFPHEFDTYCAKVRRWL